MPGTWKLFSRCQARSKAISVTMILKGVSCLQKEEQLEKVMFIPGIIISYVVLGMFFNALPEYLQSPSFSIVQIILFVVAALIFSIVFAKWSSPWLINNRPLMLFSFFLMFFIVFNWTFNWLETLIYKYSIPILPMFYYIMTFGIAIYLSIYLSKLAANHFSGRKESNSTAKR